MVNEGEPPYLDINTIIMWMKSNLIRLVTKLFIHCEISPCAQWDTTGQTVAGTGQAGDSEYEINASKGMFIDKKENNLYVADFANNRVQMFKLGQPDHAAITVASNIDKPMKIFVDDDVTGPTVYVSLRFANRVEKWTKGATQGEKVGDCFLCSGVAVDKNKNVYMSETSNHRIVRWSPSDQRFVIFAG
jgi:DNA-binding beta-propeller fold protein YncE